MRPLIEQLRPFDWDVFADRSGWITQALNLRLVKMSAFEQVSLPSKICCFSLRGIAGNTWQFRNALLQGARSSCFLSAFIFSRGRRRALVHKVESKIVEQNSQLAAWI